MKSILVITGNTDNLIMISSMLRKAGYCVIPKVGGGAGLSTFREAANIDLVISDYGLTDMDARTFMGSLKRITPVRPPVIFLSDRVDIQDYLTAFSLGAFEFLFRPVDSTEFLRIVRVAMQQEKQKDTPAAGMGEMEGRATSAGGPLSQSYFKTDSRASFC